MGMFALLLSRIRHGDTHDVTHQQAELLNGDKQLLVLTIYYILHMFIYIVH